MATARRDPCGKRLRTLWFGLLTVLGLRRLGVFVPYRYAASLPEPGSARAYPNLEPWISSHTLAMRRCLDALMQWREPILAIGSDERTQGSIGSVSKIRWTQDWFPPLDAAVAYGMVRRFRPDRIVEIGSGHSTRFLVQACRDGDVATDIRAIDPAPRADLADLERNQPGLSIVRDVVQRVDRSRLLALQSGDILSIDSSHLLFPGSDVDCVFGTILPHLPAGVIIHVHDIFLPDDYPAAWAWRGYTEQQGVVALIATGGFELLFASHYVATRMKNAVQGSLVGDLPKVESAMNSSFWLRKRTPPLSLRLTE